MGERARKKIEVKPKKSTLPPRFNIYRDLVALSPNSSWFPEIGKRSEAGNCEDKCSQTALVFVFPGIVKSSDFCISRIRHTYIFEFVDRATFQYIRQ